jgi:diadenosine tetraphosphate (Ap4A) HIT family hydrolase
MSVSKQVELARAGLEPALICRVPSGWVVLCTMQYLRGYCILLPDPVVPSLNDLIPERRARYLYDMSIVGDALLGVTEAHRINYAIMGNADQVLHSHIVPRYPTETDEFRLNTPWSYPQEVMNTTLFDPDRDQDLMSRIKDAIRTHL